MAEAAENQTQELEAFKKPEKLIVHDESDFSMLLDTGKFEQAWRAAQAFARSKLVPAHYQGSTDNCFVALVLAEQLNLTPFMVMNKTYIVHGRPGMEAQLVIALVNARGPFTGPIQWLMEGNGKDRKCTAYATHSRTGEVCKASVDWAMVEAEKWNADKEYKSGGGVQKSKWNTMPEMMFRYRSAAFLARLYCPEVLMGLSTVDELQEGDVIEVEAIPVPSKPKATKTEKVKDKLKALKDQEKPPDPDKSPTIPFSGIATSTTGGQEGRQMPPVAITADTMAKLEKIIKEKDVPVEIVCQDAEVSTLGELTEGIAVKIIEFYEKV